jgi:hypothetical protein
MVPTKQALGLKVTWIIITRSPGVQRVRPGMRRALSRATAMQRARSSLE